MVRSISLDDVCFQVERRPIFVQFETEDGEKLKEVRDKTAIVDSRSQRVLGVVGRGYRLVENQQALEWAFECCRCVFPETAPVEWMVSCVQAPSTYSFCHIDLRHCSTMLDFHGQPAGSRPEVFGPFIRVTNSYNGSRALAFDIGFFRKVCSNGLIAPDSIIRFKFDHEKREIGDKIQFYVNHDRLKAAKRSFLESMRVLRDFHVPKESFDRLVRAALLIRRPEQIEPQSDEEEAWQALDTHLAELRQRYCGELGENAYAVLNAVTDFASHPPRHRFVRRDCHSFQRLAGSWMVDFARKCRKPEFSLSKYLEQIEQSNARAAHRSAP